MGGIRVYILDELKQRFRKAAMKLYGYGKGSLSIASEITKAKQLHIVKNLHRNAF